MSEGKPPEDPDGTAAAPPARPVLRVVEGDFEAWARRLLTLLTREDSPELEAMMARVTHRATLRRVEKDTEPDAS